MKFSIISIIAGLVASVSAADETPLDALVSRQSTQFQYSCTTRGAPADFKAFNLDGCAAQLSLQKDRWVGVSWTFDAVYADGSRVTYAPFRNNANFGVSDTFYPYQGNNFITRFPSDSRFTAVHEFTNVCKGTQAPVAWFFNARGGSCGPSSPYTSGRIAVGNNGAVVSRPARVTGVSLRRVTDAGDFEARWAAVAGATGYSVIVQYPTGEDEGYNPYFNVRGARIQAGATSTVIPTTTFRQDVARKVIVHAVNAQGVWSDTRDVPPVEGRF